MLSEERDLLALSLVPGIGPRLSQTLLERFRSATRVLAASVEELQTVPQIGVKTARQLAMAFSQVAVENEIEEMVRQEVSLVSYDKPTYPSRLKTISDYPSLLYVKGKLLSTDDRAVAIVGSRQCTTYGRKMAEKMAVGLSQAGYTIVSGLARGIDGFAHQATLEAKGRTLAVLAGGLSKIYPPEHAALASQVAMQGALISETAMKLAPQRGMFHNRNRLISGLSRAVIIIEANEKSGALITARHAAEQDRTVLVVPANADAMTSAGSLRLIRDGARLVRGIDDVLEDLNELSVQRYSLFKDDQLGEESMSLANADPADLPKAGPPEGLSEEEVRIWQFLEENRHVDEVSHFSQIPISRLSGILMKMEMRKTIQRLAGNYYARR
ncbi:DNA-processing protein DprA [Telmatocola sphagniphila]|uniref:DNA-processing protein DprA n=1 Tax=Telmatocola sphagniphila TaxID=1123043 RepID=A0A8E6B843_9BACT|nr:DNA-processing protein DprA [Telmatocola sphagniphila]QVL33627.1 DNA-processing protein DprA [Telmatocola sphagniphila]